MINCKNCGVELNEHMNFCPLCGVSVFYDDKEKQDRMVRAKQLGTGKLKNEIDRLNRTQKRKFIWEVISMIIAAGILSTLLLNFIINRTLSWSLYVLIGGLAIFLFTTVYSFVKGGAKAFLAVFVICALSLLALDLVNQTLNWSIQLGMPLLLAVFAILFVVILSIRHSIEKGFNIFAYLFLASAILSILVDGIVSMYLNQAFHLSWSIIVFFSTLPIALIFLYFHYKLRKGTDLRKFFHI